MRKLISGLLGVLFIVVAYFAANWIIDSKTNKKTKVEKVIKTVFVEQVENGTIPIIVPANGNLMAKNRMELYSEVQGVFRNGSKLFRPGQNYAKGQNIIRIDAAEYAANVQSAKSNLYNQLTSIMPDLRLDYPNIYPKWHAYLTGFDMAKTTPALPEMLTDKEKFFISGRGILTTFYNVKNMEQRLSKYRINAPFNGTLTNALVTEGTLIRAGQKLGEFINTGTYELEVSISKNFSDLLNVGEQVKLTNLDKTKSFTGKVTRINGSVDQATQTIKAFIEVRDSNLREGMYLEASLNANEETNAVEVDRNLLLENNQIFIVRDSILDLMDVNPVYFSDKKVVLKAIPDGTIILSKPVMGAYTGMLVKKYQEKSNVESSKSTN